MPFTISQKLNQIETVTELKRSYNRSYVYRSGGGGLYNLMAKIDIVESMN